MLRLQGEQGHRSPADNPYLRIRTRWERTAGSNWQGYGKAK